MSFGKQWRCCPVLLSVAAAGIFTFAQKYNQNLFKGFEVRINEVWNKKLKFCLLHNGLKNIFVT